MIIIKQENMTRKQNTKVNHKTTMPFITQTMADRRIEIESTHTSGHDQESSECPRPLQCPPTACRSAVLFDIAPRTLDSLSSSVHLVAVRQTKHRIKKNYAYITKINSMMRPPTPPTTTCIKSGKYLTI